MEAWHGVRNARRPMGDSRCRVSRRVAGVSAVQASIQLGSTWRPLAGPTARWTMRGDVSFPRFAPSLSLSLSHSHLHSHSLTHSLTHTLSLALRLSSVLGPGWSMRGTAQHRWMIDCGCKRPFVPHSISSINLRFTFSFFRPSFFHFEAGNGEGGGG